MTIETSIYTLLTQSPAFAGGRVYPVMAPQGVDFPYITYEKISGERIEFLEGAGLHAKPRFRFHVFAKKYSDVKTLTNDIRERLDAYRGTVGGIAIKSVTLQNEVDFFEEDTRVYHTALDFFISHNE